MTDTNPSAVPPQPVDPATGMPVQPGQINPQTGQPWIPSAPPSAPQQQPATLSQPATGMFPDISALTGEMRENFQQLVGLMTEIRDEIRGLRADMAAAPRTASRATKATKATKKEA